MELKKHIQSSILFLAVATLSQAALAKSYKHDYKNYKAEPCSVSPFNGAFAGFGVGGGTLLSQSTANFTIDTIPDPASLILGTQQVTSLDTNDVYNYAVMGDIFLGYGRLFSYNIYAGAMIGLNIYDANNTRMQDYDSTTTTQGLLITDLTTTNQYQTTTKATRNVVEPYLDFKLGFMLHENAMVYAKGGFNYTETGVKSQTDFTSISGTIANPAAFIGRTSITSDKKDYDVGYRVGVGTEYMISPNVGIAVDYIYTFYPTRDTGTIIDTGQSTFCDIDTCIVTDANTAHASRSRLSDQQIIAQLIYHFDVCCN